MKRCLGNSPGLFPNSCGPQKPEVLQRPEAKPLPTWEFTAFGASSVSSFPWILSIFQAGQGASSSASKSPTFCRTEKLPGA